MLQLSDASLQPLAVRLQSLDLLVVCLRNLPELAAQLRANLLRDSGVHLVEFGAQTVAFLAKVVTLVAQLIRHGFYLPQSAERLLLRGVPGLQFIGLVAERLEPCGESVALALDGGQPFLGSGELKLQVVGGRVVRLGGISLRRRGHRFRHPRALHG